MDSISNKPEIKTEVDPPTNHLAETSHSPDLKSIDVKKETSFTSPSNATYKPYKWTEEEQIRSLEKKYKIEDLYKAFDCEEPRVSSRTIETVPNLKKKNYSTVLQGLLQDDNIVPINKPLEKNSTATPSKNVCQEKKCVVLCVEKRVRNVLRNHEIKTFKEKQGYTKGPGIKEKSENIPQIMKRLAERKEVLRQKNNFVRKLIIHDNVKLVTNWDFITLSHLFIVRQVIEKYREYSQMVYLAFVDYEAEAETESAVNIDNDCGDFALKSNIEQFSTSVVRNTTSPKFTEALEHIFKYLDWSSMGINIDDKNLSHLIFGRHIIIFTTTLSKLRNMLESLYQASETMELRINLEKIEVLSTAKSKYILALKKRIPIVSEHVYLGQVLSLDNAQKKETDRRIELSKALFNRLGDKFKGDLKVGDKIKLFEKYIIPTMIQGAETWIISQQQIKRLQKTQQSMERIILNTSEEKNITDEDVRNRIGLVDIGVTICTAKWRWVGQLVCRKDDDDFKFLFKILTWTPKVNRRIGRPPTRWIDDIKKIAKLGWSRLGIEDWRTLEDAYIKYYAED